MRSGAASTRGRRGNQSPQTPIPGPAHASPTRAIRSGKPRGHSRCHRGHASAAVRDDQSGARIAAMGDREVPADGGFGAGLLPRRAVVAVAGERPADHDGQAGVGVDDDLVVGGVPVVLRPLGDGVIAGGHQGAVHDEHAVLGEHPRGWSTSIDPRRSMIRSAPDFETPNNGASCTRTQPEGRNSTAVQINSTPHPYQPSPTAARGEVGQLRGRQLTGPGRAGGQGSRSAGRATSLCPCGGGSRSPGRGWSGSLRGRRAGARARARGRRSVRGAGRMRPAMTSAM